MARSSSLKRAEFTAALASWDREALLERYLDLVEEHQRVQDEQQRLIALVADLQEQMRKLQARLDTDSGNSSMPPSSDLPKSKAEQKKARREARRRRKKGPARKQGAQPGHPGHFRAMVPAEEVDRFEVLLPPSCPFCEAAVDESCVIPDVEPLRHQRYELAGKPVLVVEYQSPGCRCKSCGGKFQTPLPEVISKAGYDPALAAIGVFLRGVLQASTRDVVEFFESVLQVPASVGTVSNFEARLSETLSAPHQEAIEALRRSPVVNVDDTTWFRLSERNVLWVGTTEGIVVYRIDASKGRDAFERLIGVDFAGIVGSDRAKAFNGLDPQQRQLCWAHLDRNFQKLFDGGGPGAEFAAWALREIDALFEVWHSYQNEEITREELPGRLRLVKGRFRRLLNVGMGDEQVVVHAISKELDKLWDALWTFTKVDGVEPTNNSAERGARPAVTLRKTSLGSQSDRGDRFVERILTAAESLRKQGRDIYQYLVEATDAWYTDSSAPSFLLDGAGG